MADPVELAAKTFTAIGAFSSAFAGIPLAAKAFERRLGTQVVSNTLWFSIPLAVAILAIILYFADPFLLNDTKSLIGIGVLFLVGLFIGMGRRKVFLAWGRPRDRPREFGRFLLTWIVLLAGLETLWWAALIDAINAWRIFLKVGG